jgi:hypothetical protein
LSPSFGPLLLRRWLLRAPGVVLPLVLEHQRARELLIELFLRLFTI